MLQLFQGFNLVVFYVELYFIEFRYFISLNRNSAVFIWVWERELERSIFQSSICRFEKKEKEEKFLALREVEIK